MLAVFISVLWPCFRSSLLFPSPGTRVATFPRWTGCWHSTDAGYLWSDVTELKPWATYLFLPWEASFCKNSGLASPTMFVPCPLSGRGCEETPWPSQFLSTFNGGGSLQFQMFSLLSSWREAWELGAWQCTGWHGTEEVAESPTSYR